MLTKAGLTPEVSGNIFTPFAYAEDETAYRAIVSSGPGTGAIRAAGADKVRAAIMSAIAPFKQKKNGSFLSQNKFSYRSRPRCQEQVCEKWTLTYAQ